MNDPITLPAPVKAVRDAIAAIGAVSTQYSAPAGEGVYHHLDVSWVGGAAELRWSAAHGFELSSVGDDSVFGAAHDEVFRAPVDVAQRVAQLVAGERTTRPVGQWLAELRRIAGVSQSELAMLLGSTQPAVAQCEARSDIGTTLLVRTCAALGATLHVEAFVGRRAVPWLVPSARAPQCEFESLIVFDAATQAEIGVVPVAGELPERRLHRVLGADSRLPAVRSPARRRDADPQQLECAE